MQYWGMTLILQQTAWFFISLFLGKRGRENQHTMKKTMLALRKTPAGEEYYEVSSERGAVLATKNHQGGLDDQDDESNGKVFERPGSKRCPVKLISKYLRHLNPESSNLFQRPRSPCKSFNPAKDEVWFCSVPLGHNTLENMLRGMTSRAGIQPHLTNHSIRATTVTVLSAANYESTHKGDNWSPKRSKYWELQEHSYVPPIQSRAEKGRAVKRAVRSWANVWCGEGLARALLPRFRCN